MKTSLLDLSHTVEHGMVTYKGLPAPVICDYLSREASRARYAPGTEFHIGKIELVRCLKHSDYRAAIEPARCRACGFEFSEAKLTEPSKCPECHSTWVLEPKIGIQQRESSRMRGDRASRVIPSYGPSGTSV